MPARKRAASPAEEEDGPRRRSRRISSTPKKSKYFEDDDDDELAADDGGFDAGDGEDESEVDDEEEEEEVKPVKRGRGRPKGSVAKAKPASKTKAKPAKPAKPTKKAAQKEESEEAGDEYQDEKSQEDDEEEEEEEDDEDGRKVTFIPHVKLRPLDGVEYADETVHKNTLLFLKDLKANNKRSWLKTNDKEYRRALKDWQSFVETLTTRIAEVDATIPELPAKDLIFRIHRDIRFSKDPTPYKPHFSAAWSRTGKKGPYACYYVHLQPGSCFVGGGLWCPEKERLLNLRQSIDERPRRWRRVLNDARFKRTFLPKATKKGADDAEAAIKAFAEVNKGNALKKRPMNYTPEHRDIELLKLRNFTISKKVDEMIFTKEDAQDKVCDIVGAMEPFITFLNNIVMPDFNLDDDESDDDDEEEPEENGGAEAEDDGSPEESGDEEEDEEGKDWSTHKF